jgi:hypothetical protein
MVRPNETIQRFFENFITFIKVGNKSENAEKENQQINGRAAL